MERYIEKMLLAGLGAFSLTKEKAEEIVNDLVKRGEVSKKDQPEFVKKLLERGKDTRAEIEAIVEKTITNVLNKLNIPTKSDIDALMKKVDELAKKK
ncbi:phasin family protein [candidate division WOR-3 bacterium]|jgi:poly(hydroxyalkanoate) granule-associated protein|nr:phasin family protein [candidate division WOR-3 bacterium]